MASEKFRRQLRQEVQTWRQEQLIDEALYEQLAQRYQFAAIEQAAKHRFVIILMTLGGLLLGIGAITYVAANWQGWPRELRSTLLLAVFIVVNVAGFYLWRSPRQPHYLGQGLLLLGGILLGANMALMSQMFHQSGNLHELYLVWGLGVLAMAYGLRLRGLAGLALILLVAGYGLGIGDWASRSVSGWRVLIEQMPLVVAIAFTPLIYQCRSRGLFGLMALVVVVTLQVNLAILMGSLGQPWFFAVAMVLPPALLWSCCEVLGWRGQAAPHPPSTRLFLPISRALGVLNLSLVFYGLAFHSLWQRPLTNSFSLDADALPMLVGVMSLAAVAIAGWLRIFLRPQQRPSRQLINSRTVALTLFLTAAVVLIHTITILPVAAPLMFNLLLFALAMGLIHDGLAMGSRGMFWGGMGLLVVSILTRTLEYNTDLLLKALVFALCGSGIIIAGLWFERHVQLSPDAG